MPEKPQLCRTFLLSNYHRCNKQGIYVTFTMALVAKRTPQHEKHVKWGSYIITLVRRILRTVELYDF